MKPFWKPASAFVAIGLVLYAGLYLAAERLMYRTGDSNPFFKIARLDTQQVDWVVLGASHAMVLDFADTNATMERETGLRILNLAAQGTGPLYNRFAFEQFLSRHRTRNLLYVLDSFAFRSRSWNEDRFADAKLLARTPFDPSLLWRLARYSAEEGVDPRAVADYALGFSKINNRDRFAPDVWEGEAQFDRSYRPSRSADAKRIDYLFPATASEPADFSRYVGELKELLDLATANGVKVTAIKLPVPGRFYALLPDEAAFDRTMAEFLGAQGAAFHDFSLSMDDTKFFFDTDHLNRTGVTEFFDRDLKALLVSNGAAAPSNAVPLSPTSDGRRVERK
jgi:hypothetical protein